MKRALLPECQFDLTLIAFGFKAFNKQILLL